MSKNAKKPDATPRGATSGRGGDTSNVMKTAAAPEKFPRTLMTWIAGEWWIEIIAETWTGKPGDLMMRLDDWLELSAVDYAVRELGSVRLARYQEALETIAKMRPEVPKAEGLARECKTDPGFNIAVTVAEFALAGKYKLKTNPGD